MRGTDGHSRKVTTHSSALELHTGDVYPIWVRLSLPSFAKLNLHLRVLGRREDGFHDIFTVFQTVSLYDEIVLETYGDEVLLECDHPAVPADENNLIVKAAERLRVEFGVTAGARISLKKRIPMGGGLGGGSSNAAAVIMGLSKIWDIGATRAEFIRIGSELGSDVPFFFEGGTAMGIGRGTEVLPLDDFTANWMLIVTPDVHVSTAAAYAKLGAQNLTNEDSNRILRVCRSEAESPDFLHAALRNDFEKTVFAEHPEIERVKRRLIELGASRAMMSGSGASVFAIFDNEETRQTAIKALDNEVNWRKFAVAAVSREAYREKMGL